MHILDVQKLLVQFGFDPGPLDGVWGPKTSAAVLAFQQVAGAPATGQVDQEFIGYVGEWDDQGRTKENPEGTGTSTTGDATDGGEAETKSVVDLPGTAVVGTGDTTTVVPTGMRLVRISDPSGTDASTMYFLVGDVYGVNLAYQVGDQAALESMFGGVAAFGDVSTMSQADFDGSDMLEVGSVDEIAGATGSLQAQFDRDMRSAGLENPPAWIMADEQAMVRYVSAVNEGVSGEQMWGSLSSTQAFKNRFDGLDVVMGQLGTSSYVSGVAEYTNRELALRQSILSSRGPSADTSPEYVSSLIAAGWQATEVGELLSLEKRVRDNPEAIDNINEILTFQGLDPLDPDDFVSFLQDQDALTIDPSFAPGQVFEAVNDALRFQALLDEGINISPEFATELGTGTSEQIGSVAQFSERARIAAIEAARNANELDLGKYDLTRDDIIAATFGEESPSGKATSEVNELLEKMGRERAKAATGFASSSSYIDALGRIRVQGVSNL